MSRRGSKSYSSGEPESLQNSRVSFSCQPCADRRICSCNKEKVWENEAPQPEIYEQPKKCTCCRPSTSCTGQQTKSDTSCMRPSACAYQTALESDPDSQRNKRRRTRAERDSKRKVCFCDKQVSKVPIAEPAKVEGTSQPCCSNQLVDFLVCLVKTLGTQATCSCKQGWNTPIRIPPENNQPAVSGPISTNSQPLVSSPPPNVNTRESQTNVFVQVVVQELGKGEVPASQGIIIKEGQVTGQSLSSEQIQGIRKLLQVG